ncbi:MAG: outer-membrane lipoprotein carrier protein LolA, partial [Flavipsychrobacter sp.]
NKINTRNSKMMQSVNRIIIDCMRGSVFQNPDFKVTAYENGRDYLLSLSPVTEGMRKMFKQIDVYINKHNFDVNQLVMTEQGGDYTNMDFMNTKHNVSLNETLFRVN